MKRRTEQQQATNKAFIRLISGLKELGISNRIIAEHANTTESRLHNIMNGRSSATGQMIESIRDATFSIVESLAKNARKKDQ